MASFSTIFVRNQEYAHERGKRLGVQLDSSPSYVAKSIADIPFRQLAQEGKTHYLLDLDNCLVPRGEEHIPDNIGTAIFEARDEGSMLGMVIVTNVVMDRKWLFWGRSRVARARRIAAEIGAELVSCLFPRLKPHHSVYLRAQRLLGCRPEQIVAVGDQVWTDIRGGSRMGYTTILVEPSGPDNPVTAIRRRFTEGRYRRSARKGSS